MANENKVKVSFLALDPYQETHIPSPAETYDHGKDMMLWGDRNMYPEFLLELYASVPTLRSIIDGTTDFIVGDSQTIQVGSFDPGVVDTRGGTIRDLLEAISDDYGIFGGFAIQVIRSADGGIAELYHCPLRYLRMNKEANVFYYSEKWSKVGNKKVTVYPAFMPITPERWAVLDDNERNRQASSILLVKNTTTQTYPVPVYQAAVNACETERNVSLFHLNAVNNGFTSSMIVNFNNGVPSDEMKEEIERGFMEKFSGAQNAGRICFSWNPDKENATTITEPKVEDFGDRYDALSKFIRQQIFTSFRAAPVLFGIPTDNNGFSVDDYENAFRLYNRTMVRPVQRKICDAFDKIFGRVGVLTITPFTLDEGTEQKVN